VTSSGPKDFSRAPVIEVSGAPVPDDHVSRLRGVRIERALGLVGRATLRFHDPDFSLAEDNRYAMGQAVKIKQYPSTELFSGTVVGRSFEQLPGRAPELTIVVDDDAYKLTRGSKSVTYLSTNYTSCVKQVLGKAAVKVKITGSTRGSLDYLLQAGSDLAFVDDIARRTGFVWWVDEGVFRFEPAGTSIGTVKLDYTDIRELAVRASGLRPSEFKVSGWVADLQQKVTGQAKTSSEFGTPPAFARPYVQGRGLGTAVTGSGELSPLDKAEAQQAAQALYDESLTASVVTRGSVWVNGQIRPTTKLKIEHAGPATGEYYVTEVQHVYEDRGGFFTKFVAGPVRPAGLVDVLGKPEPDPGFAIQGLVVGVITNNSDPTHSGRVKVKYAGIPDEIESAWARVLSTSGGKNRGVVFLPEVGDEVVVGFEGNDARRPVVLGALFSKENKLPEANKLLANGKVDYRRITSRTGHVIEFADGLTPQTQHVLIKLGTAEHSIRLGADELTIEVAAGKPITIKAGTAKFAISQAGDVTIEGKNVNIKAQANLTLEGAESKLKGLGQVQVEGAMVSAKAQTMASVEAAGGPLTLKGLTVAVN
jgi:phage baseplate assembly protein gpV